MLTIYGMSKKVPNFSLSDGNATNYLGAGFRRTSQSPEMQDLIRMIQEPYKGIKGAVKQVD